jgi:hypothetical protein
MPFKKELPVFLQTESLFQLSKSGSDPLQNCPYFSLSFIFLSQPIFQQLVILIFECQGAQLKTKNPVQDTLHEKSAS